MAYSEVQMNNEFLPINIFLILLLEEIYSTISISDKLVSHLPYYSYNDYDKVWQSINRRYGIELSINRYCQS